MGHMVKLVAAGLASAGVFGGSVAVFMMARGELNSKGMSKLPVIGDLVKPPVEAELDPAGETPPPVDPDVPEVEQPTEPVSERDRSDREGVLGFPDAFNVAEIDDLLQDLGAAKENFEKRSLATDTEERRLEIERDELVQRRNALGGLLGEVRIARAELERERERLLRDIVLYEEVEKTNVKKIAKNLESMDPEGAARGLAEMEDDDVVKILSEMSSRKAGKVMAAFEPERMAQVALRMKGLTPEPTDGKTKEEK